MWKDLTLTFVNEKDLVGCSKGEGKRKVRIRCIEQQERQKKEKQRDPSVEKTCRYIEEFRLMGLIGFFGG